MANIGTTITTSSVGPSGIPTVAYSNGFFVIQSPWGLDNQVVTCTSFANFTQLFGSLNGLASVAADGTADTYTTITTSTVVLGYYAVKGYFDEKGNNQNGVAYVVRVVKASSGATAASRTFSDGAGNNTVITSKWKGLSGGTTLVTVMASPKGSTYKRIRLNHPQSQIVENWDIATAADASDASKKSQLATIALPAGGQLPSNVSDQKLQNGSSAGTADAFDAADADLVGTVSGATKTGLRCFDDVRLGTGLVAIPGKYSSTIRTGIETHVETYYRMGLLGSGPSLTQSSVVTDLSTTASNFLAYYWPQVWVANVNSDSAAMLLIDPVGHIAGLQARMDAKYRGPHKSPAGLEHGFLTVIDVERASNGTELTDDAGTNSLADSNINTIRIKGQPPRVVVWGLRTLATDLRYKQINTSRTVQVVYLTGFAIQEPYTFEPIDADGFLFAKVEADWTDFLFRLRRDGVLYGDYPGADPKPTDAYFVACNTGNNPPHTLAAGELRTDVGIVPTPNVEHSRVNIQVASPGFNRAPA